MAAPDDDVDPRFDPRFQRGYDPARHAAAEEPARFSGPDARAGHLDGENPGLSLRNAQADDDTTGADAEVASPPLPPTRRLLVAGIVLILLAVLLIAAAIVIVQVKSAAEAAGQALIARPDRFPDILLGTAPAPLAAVGCVAAVVGVALLLFTPLRRSPEAQQEADDPDGPADAPS